LKRCSQRALLPERRTAQRQGPRTSISLSWRSPISSLCRCNPKILFMMVPPSLVTLPESGRGIRDPHHLLELFRPVAALRDLLITRRMDCRDLAGCLLIGKNALRSKNQNRGSIMAKRKKGSRVQKRAKLRRGNSARRGARKIARGKATKRTVATAKSKRPTAKKAARRIKRLVAPAVETVAVGVIEQPVAITEVEETRQAS